jgi:hypothetical protein
MKRHPKTGRDRHIKMVIAGLEPQIVQQWDELLDLQTTAVPRYFSASNFAEGSFTGFDLLVKATISQLSNLT